MEINSNGCFPGGVFSEKTIILVRNSKQGVLSSAIPQHLWLPAAPGRKGKVQLTLLFSSIYRNPYPHR